MRGSRLCCTPLLLKDPVFALHFRHGYAHDHIPTQQTADKNPKRTAQHIQRTSTQTPTDASNITCCTHRTSLSPPPLSAGCAVHVRRTWQELANRRDTKQMPSTHQR